MLRIERLEMLSMADWCEEITVPASLREESLARVTFQTASFIGLHNLRWSPAEAFHRPLAVMLVHKPTRNREIGLVSVIKCEQLSETTIAFSNVKLSPRSSHREDIWIALVHPDPSNWSRTAQAI
jgi:hypothetical protein